MGQSWSAWREPMQEHTEKSQLGGGFESETLLWGNTVATTALPKYWKNATDKRGQAKNLRKNNSPPKHNRKDIFSQRVQVTSHTQLEYCQRSPLTLVETFLSALWAQVISKWNQLRSITCHGEEKESEGEQRRTQHTHTTQQSHEWWWQSLQVLFILI